jgi:ABC-type uncharacterized transport system permease subunit
MSASEGAVLMGAMAALNLCATLKVWNRSLVLSYLHGVLTGASLGMFLLMLIKFSNKGGQ